MTFGKSSPLCPPSDTKATITVLMGAFNRKYSDEQREAVARAYIPRKVSCRKVTELAASGQLKDHAGEPLDPFQIPSDTVRKIWERERARSLGQSESPLADVNPRDAVEILRRRLINVCDAELRKQERRPPGKRDLEVLRQIGRAAREAAALPGPKEPKPTKPGTHEGGTRDAGATKGGLAGAILHAARSRPAQERPPQHYEDGENTSNGFAERDDDEAHDDELASLPSLPGSRASEMSSAHQLMR